MGTKLPIPKEYVEKLNAHPCVENATEWTVSFTPEFKQKVYEEYYAGKSICQIFTEVELDVSVLGTKRLQNFRSHLIKKADKNNGFEDERKANGHKEPQSTESQMAKRIRELEHRNAYLEQENDFLKKIQKLEEECSMTKKKSKS